MKKSDAHTKKKKKNGGKKKKKNKVTQPDAESQPGTIKRRGGGSRNDFIKKGTSSIVHDRMNAAKIRGLQK